MLEVNMDKKSQALIESLKSAPLLVSDLPAALIFDRSLFGGIPQNLSINFDQKLGHLYEDALEALITASPSLSCLASHVQVFDGTKRTLGEMDFILFDRIHQQHIHLEIAVKFYLARETPDGWQYPGPNANDNWQRKLDHMQSHQLTLSQTPEAQALLAQHFNIDSIKTQQLIYGCLFTPLGCRQLPQPDAMATDRQAGRWLYISQWEEAFGDIQNVLLLPKPLWPLQVSKNTIPLFENIAASTLIEAAQERCTMFVLEDTSEKLFLVPDAWG